MCFFLVEGYRCTRSKLRYGLRLALFALLSEFPFCLAFSQGTALTFCGMNMLFTLLLCFLLLVVREKVAHRPLRILLLLALVLLSVGSDWALLAPIFTLLFAWAGTSRPRVRTAFLAATLLFGLTSFAGGVGRFSPGRNLLASLGCMAGIALAGLRSSACTTDGARSAGGGFSSGSSTSSIPCTCSCWDSSGSACDAAKNARPASETPSGPGGRFSFF